MKYIILGESTPKNLEQLVNVHCSRGYEPIGGMTTGREYDGRTKYYQAMIKPNSNEDKSSN